ncbi:response regulator [Vulgatibacter sp.]|uniref:response regulator n=1 Tax=Vulgatibacter sp. TaxID=1971226 RepID=UPI0035638F33
MDRDVLLVVEDSEAAYQQVHEAALRLGLGTEWALNGAEALRLSRLHRYRAIVLDLYLPLLDGISFLRIRRSENDGARVPVLVISATAQDEEIQRAMGLGAAAFVQKPLDVDRLAGVLGDLLQRAMIPPPTTSSSR